MRTVLKFIILINFMFLACAREQKVTVVARIGQQAITLLEFRLAYQDLLKQPDVFDSRALRERFLNELINRKLLAQEAKKRALDRNEKLQAQVEAYLEKTLRQAHYRALIEPAIKTDSVEVKAIYAYTRQQRKLKHLYFKSRARADSVYQLLRKGVPWDDLARSVFKNSTLAESGGELGWVHWDQLEYEMAMVAFGQPKGTYSKPVKSTYGYHILFVEDLKIDPFVTEEEFNVHKKKVLKLVRAKKGQVLARDYIERMMKEVKVKVRPLVMQKVGSKLSSIFRRKPSPFDEMKTFQLAGPEARSLELSLWDLRNETLAYINGKPLTVKKFIYALNFVPYRAVYKSFKTALDFVIRDQVLTDEARALNLGKKYRFVQLKTQIYQDYLLQITFRKMMAHQVSLSEIELRRYYQGHQKQFNNLPFDSVKTFLNKRMINEKRIQKISALIDSLRQNNKIELFPERVHHYYENLINHKD